MTKRFNPSKIFILTSLLFLMSSCITVDKKAGEGLVPNDQIFEIAIEEFDLPVRMRVSDSLQTVTSGALVVGAHKDPELGTTVSSAAFRMYPQKDTNSFGTNPTINYLKMYIQVGGNVVLDESNSKIPQNIYIHRLLTDLDTLKIYNNSLSEFDYDQTPLNTGGNVYFGGDTLNMMLSEDFARELVTATAEEMDSLDLFIKRFKGFVIRTEPLPGSLEGGRFNIIIPTSVSLALSYNYSDNTVANKDSVIYYFATDTDLSLNVIKHGSASLESTEPTEKIFIEGLAGIKPYIDMAQIKDMMSAWAVEKNTAVEKIVVSKAELILPYEFPQNYKTLSQYPPQIFLATKNSGDAYSNLPYYQLLSELNYSDDKGSINKSLLTYNLNITNYFQNLLKGRYSTRAELQTYLIPVASTSNSMTGELSYFVDNTVYYKGTINGNSAIRKPKLRLVYTIVP
ncbi:MAG: hypothetical protein PHV46_06900 [Bacteroidales bacterium]|nr:hypothetical protein [Bacteroidales bacterium]